MFFYFFHSSTNFFQKTVFFRLRRFWAGTTDKLKRLKVSLFMKSNIKNNNIGRIRLNKMKILFMKINKYFYENHPPTCHIKYKTIVFAPCNKSIMANKLLSTNLERFLRRIKSPLAR